MGLLSKRSAALTAALGISLAALVPATASAEPVAPASLCAPAAASSAEDQLSSLDSCIRSLDFSTAAVDAPSAIAVEPHQMTVNGSVDNPVTVTPSQFGKLLNSGSNYSSNKLFVGSKSEIEQVVSEISRANTSDSSVYLPDSYTTLNFYSVDSTRFFAVSGQAFMSLAMLEPTKMTAFKEELNNISSGSSINWLNPAGIGGALFGYSKSQRWDVVSSRMTSVNKVARKYVGADLFILPSNLSTNVSEMGGVGLLITSNNDSSTAYTATVIKVTEEPKNDSSGGGFGGIAIIGVILAAIVGILMHLNIIPRFW